ncbi:sulfotransferase family 2 domain-containing protein [Photobacterium leiognathi]|uniref:sulfotransferase family 2 domain-containing protein n=1 Tax=Photobacterium leiognathi TaxID=553611 RepID=UPI002982ABDE|nr:sulfotransferase family 2 domain-containing protein [Photobacterium leiognathi]
MKAIKLKDIGYMPIPKVACTSIKNTFFKIKENRDYDPTIDYGNHIHQYWEKNKENISDTSFKFIIIREPIKRFLSAYSNRVCHHKELSLAKIQQSNPKIAGAFEIYTPGLGQFIDNFEQYNRVNSINHHCKPVSEWVNGDMSIFDKIYPLENIAELQSDLTSVLNQEVIFPREQTGGRKIMIQDLSRNQVDFLMEFYRQDYQLLRKYYNFDDFWKEWKKGL